MKVSSRLVAINTLAQLLVRFLIVLISLGTTSFLTRQLGVTDYAAYGLLTATTTLFFAIGDWGTQFIGVREGARLKKIGQFWWQLAWFRLKLVLVGMVLYLLFVGLSPLYQSDRLVFLAAASLLLFLSLKTTAQTVFQIKLQHYLSALLDLFSALAFFVFLVWGGATGFSQAIMFLIGATFLTSLVGFGLLIIFQKPVRQKKAGWAKKFWRQSRTMGLVMIVYSVLSRIPLFFLKTYFGAEELGYFVLAQKMYDNLIFGAAYLMNVLYPIIASFWSPSDEKERVARVVRVSLLILLLVGGLVLVGGWFLAKPVIELIGGVEFGPAVGYLRGLLVVLVVSYLNHATGYTMIGIGEQRRHFWHGGVGLVVSLLTHWLATRFWGGLGVLVGLISGEMVIFLLSYDYLTRRLGMRLNLRFQELVEVVNRIKEGR